MIKSAVLVSMLLSTAAYADDAQPSAPATVVITTPTVIVEQQPQPPSVVAPLAPPVNDIPAPPQNEAWSNVSHINGVPVPVGERNRYLYEYKKNNLQTNPIGLMLGYYEIAASHALSNNVALSVELSYSSTDSGQQTATQIAASLPIYFKRTFSGPYLEPGILVRNESSGYGNECFGDSDCSSNSSASFAAIEMMLGWSWMFDSGLNMSAAFGVAKRLGDQSSSDNYDDDQNLEPAGYFRVGYAF
jgi:hypothetical protein